MQSKIPEHYYCPKCNTAMVEDLVDKLQNGEMVMPTMYVVQMGVDILKGAGCPLSLVKPVWEWAKTYGKNKNELNEEEQDKLKLVKWQEWATK